MEAENGQTKAIYLRTNHFKIARSGITFRTEKTVREVCRTLEISEQTYYRRRKKFGGVNTNQAKKLKTLVAELSLDNAILKEVLSKNNQPGQAASSG